MSSGRVQAVTTIRSPPNPIGPRCAPGWLGFTEATSNVGGACARGRPVNRVPKHTTAKARNRMATSGGLDAGRDERLLRLVEPRRADRDVGPNVLQFDGVFSVEPRHRPLEGQLH